MKPRSVVCLLTMVFTLASAAYPCTIIVAGKKATVDGSVLNSHTDTCNNSRLMVVPGRTFPKGTLAPLHWGIQDVALPLGDFGEVIGRIPQAERTYSYIHSGYPHINEHQLAIGESTTSQREELRVEREGAKQIMTVEQAMALALQRCKRAREAVAMIGEWMETYGFLPSCGPESEDLCIADPDEAWIMEMFSVGPGWEPGKGIPGVIWAAQRVPDDEAAIVPNWSIIKEIDLDKPDWFMASSNYQQFAIDRGWYDPAAGKPFVWQEIYAPIPREWATGRFWLFFQTIAPRLRAWPERQITGPFSGIDPYHQYVEPLSLYPFSAKPEKPLGVEDLMKLQRSVNEGTIYDMTADPDWLIPDGRGGMKLSPLTTPFPTRPMRELLKISSRRNVARGNYGMIAQLRGWLPDPIGGVYWVYLDNQYTGIYVPIHAGVERINPLYSTYDPDRFSEDSARWVYDFAENLLYLKWQEAIRDLRAVRDPLEREFMEKLADVDKTALEMMKKNPGQARAFLTESAWTNMDRAVKAYRDLRVTLISKYTNNKQGS